VFPDPRLIGAVVTFAVLLSIVRLTSFMVLLSFADAFIRKFPDMFALLVGVVMVMLGGDL